jgi:2-iminobutanoate/2-iminopropanoate deaminase
MPLKYLNINFLRPYLLRWSKACLAIVRWADIAYNYSHHPSRSSEVIMSCCCAKKKVVSGERGPKAIGPYSVAIEAGQFVFASGQLGLDPATGELVAGGIEAETHQALNNVGDVLRMAGSGMVNVVKATVFLRDINDFGAMNAVYAKFFPENPPARSAFQVAALPKGAAVEIEVVAIIPKDDCDCDCGSQDQ